MKTEQEIREEYGKMLVKGKEKGRTPYGEGWKDAIEWVLGIN